MKKADLGLFEDAAKQTSGELSLRRNFLRLEYRTSKHCRQRNRRSNGIYNPPKNSIKIPTAGVGTYSPDFAYIVKTKSGEVLNFVIEAQGVAKSDDLRKGEERKIEHAETLFAKISENIKVVFKTQFEEDKIVELIRQNM